MRKQNFVRLYFVILFNALLFFCSPVLALGELPKEIKVGVILPLTGPMASLGNASQRGMMMAVDSINKGGYLKDGAQIKVIWGDDEAKPEVGISEAERMIGKEKVDLLMGSYTSAVTFPVTQVAERNKVPIVTPTGAKDEITERGFKYNFRICTKAGWVGKEQVMFLKWLSEKSNIPIKTIGLLFEDSGWGESVVKSVYEESPKQGLNIITSLSYSARDTKDFRSTILKLQSANPDVVIQVSYTMDAILITQMMHALQFDCKGIVATATGHTTQEYHDAVGKLAEYLFSWNAWSAAIPIDEVKVRSKEHEEKYHKPMEEFVALWYSSCYVVAKALNEARSVDKEMVRNALTKVSLRRGEKGNLLQFDVNFDKTGQNPNARGVYTQVLNGKMELIYPEFAAAKKFVFPIPKWSERK